MANDEMLKAAEAEVLRLEAEISKTTLGQKLSLAKQVVALYRRDATLNAIQDPGNALDTIVRGMIRDRVTKTAQIEKVCADHLRAIRKRATSGQLAEIVEANGIHLSGAMPSKSLAAVLSNSDLFDNNREEGGYGLAEWSQRGAEIETATSQ